MNLEIRPENRRLRFDPTINYGHLLTAGTMIIGALVVWTQSQIVQAKQDLRIAYVEAAATENANALRKLTEAHQQMARSQERVTITLDLLTKNQKPL